MLASRLLVVCKLIVVFFAFASNQIIHLYSAPQIIILRGTTETRFSSCYDFLPQKKRFFRRLHYLPTVDKQSRKSWLRFASYRSSG